MNNEFTNLDDILEAAGDRDWIGKAAWIALKVIIVAFSASTTFLFFSTFAGSSWEGLVGTAASPYVAGLVGVLVFDLATLIWSYLRAHHADTDAQMSIAYTTAVAMAVGALLTTALYLSLRTTFQVGIVASDGGLSSLGQTLHYGGLVVIILGVVVNFGAVFLYTNAGMNMRQATQERRKSALLNAGRHAAEEATIRQTVQATLDHVFTNLPARSRSQGDAGRSNVPRY